MVVVPVVLVVGVDVVLVDEELGVLLGVVPLEPLDGVEPDPVRVVLPPLPGVVERLPVGFAK